MFGLEYVTGDEVSFQEGVFDAEDHLVELLNVLVCHFGHMKFEPVREKSLELRRADEVAAVHDLLPVELDVLGLGADFLALAHARN